MGCDAQKHLSTVLKAYGIKRPSLLVSVVAQLASLTVLLDRLTISAQIEISGNI